MSSPKFYSLTDISSIPTASRNVDGIYFLRTPNGFGLFRVADTANRDFIPMDISDIETDPVYTADKQQLLVKKYNTSDVLSDLPASGGNDGLYWQGATIESNTSATNVPGSGSYFTGINLIANHNPNYRTLFGSTTNGDLYVINKFNGVWGAWQSIATRQWVNSVLPATFLTVSSNNTDANHYIKVATFKIKSQTWAESYVIDVTRGHGGASNQHCYLLFRVIQNSAFGNDPQIEACMYSDRDLSTNYKFWYVITQNTNPSTVEIYAQPVTNFCQLAGVVINADHTGSNEITFYNGGQTYIASLPSGTSGQFAQSILASRDWVSSQILPTNLSAGASSGQIISSTGNDATLTTLGLETRNDANAATPMGFHAFVNGSSASNYPVTGIGSGLIVAETQNQPTGLFEFWKSVANDDIIYYRTGASSTTYNAWNKIASREWVATQLHAAVTVAGENYLQLSGQEITADPIDLNSSNTTGILPISKGGLGAGFIVGWIKFSGASYTTYASIPYSEISGAPGAQNLSLGSATGTTQPVNISGGGTGVTLPAVTSSTAGLMTSADKQKLDGIESGAQANVQTDWNATSGDALLLNKPTTLPPSGNAGGDLTGTYPNPAVKANAITTTKIADQNVTFTKLPLIAPQTILGNEGPSNAAVASLTLGSGISISGGAIQVDTNPTDIRTNFSGTYSMTTAQTVFFRLSGNSNIALPDPASYVGKLKRIVVLNSSGGYTLTFTGANTPFNLNDTPLTASMTDGQQNNVMSDGNKWYLIY